MLRNLKSLHFWLEILVRIALVAAFLKLENVEPFQRKILPDEIWIYRYPVKSSYVPVSVLWPLVTLVPTLIFIVNYIFTRHSKDLKAAVLGHTLSFGLNGVLIDIIKITVGRPRPDFFYRCFPDGVMNSEMICTGEYFSVQDGRKSFPSGHSSFSFATLGYLSFYLMGKLKIFSEGGRGKSIRLIVCFFADGCSDACCDIKDNGLSSLEGRRRHRLINRFANRLHVLPSIFPINCIEEV